MIDEHKALSEAEAALASADTDMRTALARAEQTSEHLSDAEAAYDREPTDAAGRAVIAAREAHELAKLRAERATLRHASALTARDGAKLAVEVANARAAVASRVAAVDGAQNDFISARSAYLAAVPPAHALALVLNGSDGPAFVRVTAEQGKLNDARAALYEAEETLFALSPDDATPERTAARSEAHETHLRELASVDRYRESIAADVAIIAGAYAAILGSARRIDARYSEACERVRLARAQGVEVPDLDPAHRVAHVLYAVGEALPNTDYPRARINALASIRRLFGVGSWAYATAGITPKTSTALDVLPFLGALPTAPVDPGLTGDEVDLVPVFLRMPDQHTARTVYEAHLDSLRPTPEDPTPAGTTNAWIAN